MSSLRLELYITVSIGCRFVRQLPSATASGSRDDTSFFSRLVSTIITMLSAYSSALFLTIVQSLGTI